MRIHVYLFAMIIPALSFADNMMPSDAQIQKQMVEKSHDFDKSSQDMSQLPVKPIVGSDQVDVPDFMVHGFGGVARDAHAAASKALAANHNRRALMLAVSFSMPESVLVQYAQQAEEAHARLILRGVPPGTNVPQVAAMIKRINQNHKAEWSIDPPLFRRFKISKVPALIYVDEDAAQKLDNQCAPELSFLEVDGEVSIRQALYLMSREHSKLGTMAANRLHAIEQGTFIE